MDTNHPTKEIDLVMREDDFIIFQNGAPLHTFWGSEVSHHDSRLLKHLMIRLALSREPAENVSSYLMFSYQIDKLAKNEDWLLAHFAEALKQDYLVQQRFHTQSSDLVNLKKAIELTKNNQQVFNLLLLHYN